MRISRERWLLLFGLFLLFAIGNVIANRTTHVKEIVTFVLLVAGLLVYLFSDYHGWIDEFYLVSRTGKTKAASERTQSKSSNGLLIFAAMTVFCVAYVELTGGAGSPLFCILYLLPLMAGVRYGFSTAVVIAVLFSVRYFGAEISDGNMRSATHSVALSFPLAALFGALLRVRLSIGMLSVSEKVTELQGLMDVSQMLEMALDLETTLNLLLINARRIVDADVCAVYLLDIDNTTLRLAAPLVDEVSARFNPSIAVDTLESEKWTMASENVLQLHRSAGGSDDPRTLQWPEARSNDAMIASLIGSEGILGLLYVARNRFRQPFSDKEGLLLRAFADHISMPLQKAKYQETLSLLAFKDEMTGLSNFRYFERRLSEDLIRAKRYKQTLTLIIMDIDHFKKFNDVYGHKAGNVLLKQFGQLLKDCLRESDLPARYGGEEFIAICPAISGLEALIVAERIRTTFEQARFDLGESLTGAPVNVKITVSVGCATYPDHGLSPNHLVRQADRALYAAKNRGRNIVVSCDELSESDNPSPEKSPSER